MWVTWQPIRKPFVLHILRILVPFDLFKGVIFGILADFSGMTSVCVCMLVSVSACGCMFARNVAGETRSSSGGINLSHWHWIWQLSLSHSFSFFSPSLFAFLTLCVSAVFAELLNSSLSLQQYPGYASWLVSQPSSLILTIHAPGLKPTNVKAGGLYLCIHEMK